MQDKKWRQAITAAGSGEPCLLHWIDCQLCALTPIRLRRARAGMLVVHRVLHQYVATVSVPEPLVSLSGPRLSAGCMAALQAEHFLAAHEELEDGRTAEAATAEDDAATAEAVRSTEHLSTQAVALANGLQAKENAAKNPVPA